MNPIEEKIKQLFHEKLGISPNEVFPEAHLKTDIGLDSLDAVEMVMLVEQAFNVTIPDEVAEEFQTVGDMIDWITTATGKGGVGQS